MKLNHCWTQIRCCAAAWEGCAGWNSSKTLVQHLGPLEEPGDHRNSRSVFRAICHLQHGKYFDQRQRSWHLGCVMCYWTCQSDHFCCRFGFRVTQSWFTNLTYCVVILNYSKIAFQAVNLYWPHSFNKYSSSVNSADPAPSCSNHY